MAALFDYGDLARARVRMDELSRHWDASAVLALWTEPGEPPTVVSGLLPGTITIEHALARAWGGGGEPGPPVVRWRQLDAQDNLLCRENLVTLVPASVEGRDDRAVEFLTPHGGRGRLVVLDGQADVEALHAEALVLALRLPETLRRAREHEAMLRTGLGGSRNGTLVVGANGTLRFANAAAQRMLELEAEVWTVDLGAIAEGQLVDLVRRAQRAHGSVSGEFEGPRGPVSADVLALRPGPDAPMLLHLHDLAERRRVERQQNEFVGTVGHELKTPLTSALTALELVCGGETGTLDPEQERMLVLVTRNLVRLEHLVQQLLDTARQRVGRLVLRRQEERLGPLLDATLEAAHRAAQRAGRDFVAAVDPTARAHVDAVRFAEIVENLVGNSLKFTDAGGHVAVRLRAEMPCPFPEAVELAHALGVATEGCELEVCDDGVGMDPTTREHAFEPFYQDGDPLADRPSGAGLGLAIVRSLVEAHDGHVEIDSEPGCGTCVRVWTPTDPGLAAVIAGLGRTRRAAREILRRQGELRIELAPLSPTAEADLAGLDHVEGSDIVLVRLGPAHLVRLSTGTGRGVPLPGAVRAVLGKDAPRIGTTLARLAAELRGDSATASSANARTGRPRA